MTLSQARQLLPCPRCQWPQPITRHGLIDRHRDPTTLTWCGGGGWPPKRSEEILPVPALGRQP